jgi:hypothetical protein
MKKLVLVLLTAVLLTSCTYTNTEKVNCVEVMGKERINVGDGGYYLVFTSKGEFKVEDDLFRGNFESSSWYGQMKSDHNYTFEVGGYRIPFLSMYPNITTQPIECVSVYPASMKHNNDQFTWKEN